MGRNNRIGFYSISTSNDEIVVTSSLALMNEKSMLITPGKCMFDCARNDTKCS